MPQDHEIDLERRFAWADKYLETSIRSTDKHLDIRAASQALLATARKVLNETAEIAKGYKPTMW